MITLKDLNLLINHLHKANQIFDTEASIEERKYRDAENNIFQDKRTQHAPRSVMLHHKAELINALEKKLLEECDVATVTLEENTIYSARELIAESVYPWLLRKEPPTDYIDELMSDETFVPFSHGLSEKKKKLLGSSIHILMLPLDAEKELQAYIMKNKSEHNQDITISLSDVISHILNTAGSVFISNEEYKKKLITFRLYTLGLLEDF